MDDINSNVFAGFNLKFEKFRKSRNGIGLYTGDRKIIIKKSSVSLGRLLFSHNVKERLHENGIRTDRYLCGNNGYPFVEANGGIYTAVEYLWQDHAECDLTNRKHVIMAVEALCRLHDVVKGMSLPNGCDTECRMAKWQGYYIKRRKELAHIKKWVSKQSCMSRMDIVFLRNYETAVSAAERGISLAQSVEFQKMIDRVDAEGLICHNRYRDDILKVGADDLVITGFEESGYNHPIIDLREIIRRYIKKAAPNADAVLSIINLYAKHNALSDEEVKILLESLLIPDKYLQIVNQYYNKRRTWVPYNIIKHAENTIEHQLKQNQLLHEIISAEFSKEPATNLLC